MNNDIREKMLYVAMRSDFHLFLKKCFAEIHGDGKFKDNWHIRLISSKLEDMMAGEFNKLIINLPPRHLKSFINSVAFPAFWLGHHPSDQVMCVSYSDDLAIDFADKSRKIMMTDWYMNTFPETRISKTRYSVQDFKTTKNGGRRSGSINGGITGHGGEVIIVDDPMKAEDALSDTQRDKVNNWFNSALHSRRNDKKKDKILIVMQRLHENDLTGFLLGGLDKYNHINLPLIAENEEKWNISPKSRNADFVFRKAGEPLHAKREDVDEANITRATVGEYIFASQYQQNPISGSVGFVKKSWLEYYNVQIPRLVRLIHSWDTAQLPGIDNAYSACVKLGVAENGDILVLDVFRDKLEFPDLVKKVESMALEDFRRYRLNPEIVIEKASSGISLIQSLNKKWHRFAFKPEASKEMRFISITPYIEAKNVLFPNFHTSWWEDFEQEILTFPTSRFKDQCDALSQGVNYIKTSQNPFPNQSYRYGDAPRLMAASRGSGFSNGIRWQHNTYVDPRITRR